MGTSANLGTPSGGAWTPVKRRVTSFLGGGSNVTPDQIVGGTIAAAKGLLPAGPGGVGNGQRAVGGQGGGATGGSGGGGGGGRTGIRSGGVGRAVSGLGGFAASVGTGGLDEGLRYLNLEQLRGQPAAAIIASIADHLADGAEGLGEPLLATALREAVFEAAALEGDRTYENLDASLQGFLQREGIEGLIACFLTRLVFNSVWTWIESHVNDKAEGPAAATAMATAVEGCCRGHVNALIDDEKAQGRFDKLDWFGRDGRRLGDQIASDLESRIRALGPEES
jgi:hypothetical protein